MNKAAPALIAVALALGLLVVLFTGTSPDPDEAEEHPRGSPSSRFTRAAEPERDDAGSEVEEDAAEPMKFGMDVHSLEAMQEAEIPPDYATFWVGPWNLEHGWGEPRRQIEAMREADAIPAIHFYYWGDDLTRACFERGCMSPVHQVQKSQERWNELADTFIAELNGTLAGWPILIFVETEFNKADVAGYEPLDEALADLATRFSNAFPNATIVLPLGNWNLRGWSDWDQAADASDYIGVQALRGSTRDSNYRYLQTFGALTNGAEHAHNTFDKPVVIHDLALSTYPEPAYLQPQRMVLQHIFTHLDELKEAGVEAITYRSWFDDPEKPLGNHYGPAERHWGLAHADGATKPAADVWVEGVKDERGMT